jgi:PrtD family type I secretion system ABC transporter
VNLSGPPRRKEPSRLSVTTALSAFRSAFIGIGVISGVVNVLALTGAFFMLQVYDRVIPGRSVPTLVGLVVLAGSLYVFQGILELIRSRLLVRIGVGLDAALSGQVYKALMRLPLRTKVPGDGLQSLRDLDQVRSFLSGAGPTALFDLPWTPLYIGICFLFHFWIGVTALAGAILLFALTLLTEIKTKGPSQIANSHAAARSALAEATRRNVEVLEAMGFGDRIAKRWSKTNAIYLNAHAKASDAAGTLATISRILRMALQSGMLAIGALLVISQEATGGIMIASSIMMSRALAPVELAIANWKGFISARQGWSRLRQLLELLPEEEISLTLPSPSQTLAVENVSVAPPGLRKVVVQGAHFVLKAGDGLGIIGPSASGKSSFARALAGIWQPATGTIRLDGATHDQWSSEQIGRHIGYLPQDVQLFDGTIAENIARFDPEASSELILAAAETARVHDFIVRLPDGYETKIGEFGSSLSAGQRQRIALARALYNDPFLVVLDEPNSNLDAEGEAGLTSAIQAVRDRGAIIVVIAHRPSALASLNLVLMLANGQIQAFGPKSEVLNKVTRQRQGSMPLRVVAGPEDGVSDGR